MSVTYLFESKMADETGSPAAEIIEPVTCLVCGCMCDDITLVKEGDRLTEARNACAMGREWFLRDRSEDARSAVARINGEPAEISEAVSQAAVLLEKAKAPIILGLTGSSCETVAAAVQLGDQIGAVIEVGSGGMSLPRILAFQRCGRVAATLGEVKNRADVVMFWGADPVVSHPRHWERYSVEPHGRFVLDGRSGRTVIVVDEKRTPTADQADQFVAIDSECQFAVLWVLRALVRGIELEEQRVRLATGCDLGVLRELAARLMEARYGAFFHGPRLGCATLTEAAATIEAASWLVRDLNQKTRFIMLGMGEPGNAPGAEAVLAWQTGFPASVDLSPGYPVSLPGTTGALERLLQGEADLAVIVGRFDLEALASASREKLERIPKILIASADLTKAWSTTAEVICVAAVPGLEEQGNVMRVDGVSLPLRPIRPSRFLSERQWLEAIGQRIASEGSA
jgi:formylmethanofuran dehydrogenase subunit B